MLCFLVLRACCMAAGWLAGHGGMEVELQEACVSVRWWEAWYGLKRGMYNYTTLYNHRTLCLNPHTANPHVLV